MFALNFQSPHHKKLLIERKKNCTVRLGDVSDVYLENSVVWITIGKPFQSKRKLYTGFIDKVITKTIAELTTHDLDHQNPEISSIEELISFFEKVYQKSISMEDMVTVIYFSEIIDE